MIFIFIGLPKWLFASIYTFLFKISRPFRSTEKRKQGTKKWRGKTRKRSNSPNSQIQSLKISPKIYERNGCRRRVRIAMKIWRYEKFNMQKEAGRRLHDEQLGRSLSSLIHLQDKFPYELSWDCSWWKLNLVIQRNHAWPWEKKWWGCWSWPLALLGGFLWRKTEGFGQGKNFFNDLMVKLFTLYLFSHTIQRGHVGFLWRRKAGSWREWSMQPKATKLPSKLARTRRSWRRIRSNRSILLNSKNARIWAIWRTLMRHPSCTTWKPVIMPT